MDCFCNKIEEEELRKFPGVLIGERSVKVRFKSLNKGELVLVEKHQPYRNKFLCEFFLLVSGFKRTAAHSVQRGGEGKKSLPPDAPCMVAIDLRLDKGACSSSYLLYFLSYYFYPKACTSI